VAEPKLFQESLREAANAPAGASAAGAFSLLPSLRAYLSNVGGAILSNFDLGLYITSAESTRSSDPTLLDALSAAQRIRAILDSAPETIEGWTTASGNVSSPLSSLQRLLGGAESRYGILGADASALMKRLADQMQLVVPPAGGRDVGAGAPEVERTRVNDQVVQRLAAARATAAELQSALIEMRRYSTVGLLS